MNSNKLHFYSQNMEDYFLYRYYLNTIVSDGIYVELGAQNGVENSNTFFLEQRFGYKGLLIEPSPNQFNSLVRNRGSNYCENYAIDIDIDEKIFIGNNACAGLKYTMAKSHMDKWHVNSREYKVKTIPIKYLIKKHNINYIDFFSIDVEGGEELILETMDWSIPVFIICIELDNQNKEKDERCRQILIEKEFEFLIRMNNNDFFINKKYFRAKKLYNKVINSPIDLNNNAEKMHHPNNKCWHNRLNFKEILEDFDKKFLTI